jgi:hypothetical protein
MTHVEFICKVSDESSNRHWKSRTIKTHYIYRMLIIEMDKHEP